MSPTKEARHLRRVAEWYPRFVGFAMVLFVAFIMLMTYWKFAPYGTVTYNSITIPATVKAGQPFVYTVHYCRKTTIQTIVGRTLLPTDPNNIFTYPYPIVGTTVPADCPGTKKLPLVAFPTLPPGQYRLKIVATFQVNPIRNIERVGYSNVFTVAP